MLQVGIVGLPNVGKSTLFNALLRRQQAVVANYPFATIEPNIGVVPVPDERLTRLQQVTQVAEQVEHVPIVPATVRFVDIAGLVEGAAEGAGLGNKFLAHIRDVDLICEVVRAFPDSEIIREGSTSPQSDIATLNTELILADLQTLEKSSSKKPVTESKKKSAIQKLITILDSGKLVSEVSLSDEEKESAKELHLLTAKKLIYVFNVNTVSLWDEALREIEALNSQGKKVCVIDAKLEAELSILSPDEQEEYLASLGVADSGVNSLLLEAYAALDLISFLTAGVKEVRAWTVPRGTKAPQAAGTIHSDFEKGFIKAEVVDFTDFVHYNGWKGVRPLGRTRFEGRDYVVKDGDVVEFKTNP